MEFKTLTDQLNSACEEYFGSPQASGFPVRDELNQEPVFQGFRTYNGTYYDAGQKKIDIITSRETLIMEKIREVFKNESKNYELKLLTPIPKSAEDLVYKHITTNFYFDKLEIRGKQRYWKVMLCNCRNWNIRDDAALKVQSCLEVQKGNEEKTKNCLSFEVTWSKKLSEEEAKEIAISLWYAFDIAPQKNYNKYLLFDKGMSSDQGKNAKAEVQKTNFDPWWEQISQLYKATDKQSEESKEELEEESKEELEEETREETREASLGKRKRIPTKSLSIKRARASAKPPNPSPKATRTTTDVPLTTKRTQRGRNINRDLGVKCL
eukprot:GHVP01006999.1.p1 GENE.GHVP01006999.1~~GHVP01006999.1.p1  ORF type:complete len:323 (-),score=58.56 GHVP01006999.1:859-1827(-)